MDYPSEIKVGLRLSESGKINQVRVGGAVVGIEQTHLSNRTGWSYSPANNTAMTKNPNLNQNRRNVTPLRA
ncbi:hypothetical protein J2TS6_01320 [Paenibacillus albilobatus]|uniref:Uncharacterized protein n=1 Tax=Paenibacillus albilobatus TaxID=2716884 RepID=A0A920C7H6_9BACL|nr:hypothetical protein J2TS6_01320 [Paenibacillus albilobatus]